MLRSVSLGDGEEADRVCNDAMMRGVEGRTYGSVRERTNGSGEETDETSLPRRQSSFGVLRLVPLQLLLQFSVGGEVGG